MARTKKQKYCPRPPCSWWKWSVSSPSWWRPRNAPRTTGSSTCGAKDLESTRQFAIEKFAQDLVAVIDSLELAIATSQKEGAGKADAASLIEGEKATLRLLAKAFEKAQIEEINPQGQLFNPELHEAMMAQPSDAPPNTVLAVIQKGYQLNGRLLRPARVVVSAAKN